MTLSMGKLSWRDAVELTLPKEHGSWSLALEPLALGLLIAPSAAGVALAVAATSGFFLRRPLKIFLRESDCERWKIARASVLILTVVALANLALAAEIGGFARLWPLLPAAAAGLAFAWFDSHNEAREGAAEISGAVAFGLLPAAFGALAGWSLVASLALTAAMLVRSVPTVLTVRANLRIKKGQSFSILPAFAAVGTGITLATWLASLRLAPWTTFFFAVIFAERTIWLLLWRPQITARQIGITEAVLGGLMVLALAGTWKHF